MKKKLVIYLVIALLFLQTTVYAFVPNGRPHENSKASIPVPKVLLYVDNYLENPTSDAKPYIGVDNQIMIPTNIIGVAPWTERNSTTGEISIDKGKYKIAKDYTTVTTPNGVIKMKNAAALSQERICVSVEFLQKAMKRQVDIQIIDGIKCVFIWDKLPPGKPTPNIPPKDSYLKYQNNPLGWGYSEKTKYWMGWTTLGGNIDNTKTRAKDSTIEEDWNYLYSILGNVSANFKPSYRSSPCAFFPSPYSQLSVRKGWNNDVRVMDITGWYSVNQKRANNIHTKNLEYYVGYQNAVFEAMKYLCQKQEDATLLYNYIDKCLANERYPSYGTKMTFGDTEVVIFPNASSAPEFDIHFNQNNWGDLWTRTTEFKYDYSTLFSNETPIYLLGLTKDLKSISNPYMIGSNVHLTKVRNPKSTLKEDIDYLNQLNESTGLCWCDTWGGEENHDHGGSDLSIVPNGTLITSDLGNHTFIKDRITVTPKNSRKFSIDDSWYMGQTNFKYRDEYKADYYIPEVDEFIVRQNYIIEIIKYLSKDSEDGERIYLYLDDCIKKGISPTLKTPMSFGNTKVTFEKGKGKLAYIINFL